MIRFDDGNLFVEVTGVVLNGGANAARSVEDVRLPILDKPLGSDSFVVGSNGPSAASGYVSNQAALLHQR